jgi:tetratricopeptide (TPR) repeat protein
VRGSVIVLSALAAFVVAATQGRAQSAIDSIAAGDTDHAALNSRSALRHYEGALTIDPTNYDALCRAAWESVDLGEFSPTDSERLSLYGKGEEYARRAVAANPQGVEGHFELARAVGRTTLTMAKLTQILRGGLEVHKEALAALAIDPTHAGALHVMGVWNQMIMKQSWASRTIAKTLLGAHVLSEASWDNAQRYLEQALALQPSRIIHHLDLGLVYADRGEKAKARDQFAWIKRAPVTEYNDANYKRQAAQALQRLGGESTRSPVLF